MRIVRRFFYIWVMSPVSVAFKIICWRMAEDGGCNTSGPRF